MVSEPKQASFEKGKPGENLGRKAMGLKSQSDYDSQAAEENHDPVRS
jgi:hypothetical protein